MYEWSRPNRSNKNQLTPLSVQFHVVLFDCAYANIFLDNLRIFYLTRVFASNLFISHHLKLPFALFFISIKFAFLMLRFSLFKKFESSILVWSIEKTLPFLKKNYFRSLDWFKDSSVVKTCQMQTFTRRDFKWPDSDEGTHTRVFTIECRRHLMQT